MCFLDKVCRATFNVLGTVDRHLRSEITFLQESILYGNSYLGLLGFGKPFHPSYPHALRRIHIHYIRRSKTRYRSKISLGLLQLESSSTTRVKGFIEPNRFPLHLERFLS